MTAVIYKCITKEGKNFEVKTLAKAREIQAAGGSYEVKYEEYHPQSEKEKAVK